MVILKELANRSIVRLTKQLSIELHIEGGTARSTHTHTHDAATGSPAPISDPLAMAMPPPMSLAARVPISTIPCPHADLTFGLMRLSPPRHIISNTHPDPNEHCIGHQTTHNDHANHDSTRSRTRSVTVPPKCRLQRRATHYPAMGSRPDFERGLPEPVGL